ncbi:MAG TPA: DUF1456 family protein [Flavobacterium sp.]|nr:DUF1456 family protein [Flavobacterium sp.]
MNNNDIFKKLRVALQLRDDQIVEILELVDFRVSKAELSAFFRNQDHPNFVECGDQVLRNFLNGLVIHLRGTKENPKNALETIRKNAAEVKSPAKGIDPKLNDKKPFVKTPAKKGPSQKPKKPAPKIQIVEQVRFNNGKNIKKK